jgi:hypothetical protein
MALHQEILHSPTEAAPRPMPVVTHRLIAAAERSSSAASASTPRAMSAPIANVINSVVRLHDVQMVVPEDIRLRSNAQAVLEALAAMGVLRATVRYSGGGDEGGVEEAHVDMRERAVWEPSIKVAVLDRQFKNVDGAWIHVSGLVEVTLEAAITTVAEDVMSHFHGSFWNGAGGEGHVIFCCEAMKTRIEHTDFYTASTCSEHEL